MVRTGGNAEARCLPVAVHKTAGKTLLIKLLRLTRDLFMTVGAEDFNGQGRNCIA